VANLNIIHKELAAGRWATLSFLEQMANIGSEIERTVKWKNKGNAEYSRLSFERALELLDLTIANTKKYSRLKELVRTREALADHFVFDNIYKSTDKIWTNYFFGFTFAAQAARKKQSFSTR
jgi:hypothetical protein